jgi:cohesin loading factor subunit SCC2
LVYYPGSLQSEEVRIDGGEADAKMDAKGNITVSKKVSGDQDGDATLFGGVLTNHASRLFDMTHSKQPLLRYSALELLGLLLRQGLVSTVGILVTRSYHYSNYFP